MAQASGRLVMGIDASTTAVKAIVWDEAGRLRAQGRRTYGYAQPRPLWYEQDADHWWQAAASAIREALSRVEPGQVAALSIANQRETFVPVDKEGQPLRPAILWLDERCQAEIDWAVEHIGADRILQVTGRPPDMTPCVYKMLWLKRHEPDIYARTWKFLDVHAFLVHRLTGRFVTSWASADPMGVFDMANHRWAAELLREFGLDEAKFCDALPPGAVLGRVSRAAADACGLAEGTLVVSGAGDGQAAGLGVNAIEPGRAYLNLGTAVVSGIHSDRYRPSRAYRVEHSCAAGAYVCETLIRSGTHLVSWFVGRFAPDLEAGRTGLDVAAEELLELAASKVDPGAGGLLVVPYWNSAGTPFWDPLARGITLGWHPGHGRPHFYRAILEGLAFEQRLSYEVAQQDLGTSIREIVLLGGGSQSRLWSQILADVLGAPVRRSAEVEATALGAGILAACAAGLHPDVYAGARAMTGWRDAVHPEPERQRLYDELYGLYRRIYPSVREVVGGLSRLLNRG